MFNGMQYISIHPRSVAVNHAGLWIRRHQFESGRGYHSVRYDERTLHGFLILVADAIGLKR